jgi:hypothetical protein
MCTVITVVVFFVGGTRDSLTSMLELLDERGNVCCDRPRLRKLSTNTEMPVLLRGRVGS